MRQLNGNVFLVCGKHKYKQIKTALNFCSTTGIAYRRRISFRVPVGAGNSTEATTKKNTKNLFTFSRKRVTYNSTVYSNTIYADVWTMRN